MAHEEATPVTGLVDARSLLRARALAQRLRAEKAALAAELSGDEEGRRAAAALQRFGDGRRCTPSRCVGHRFWRYRRQRGRRRRRP